jgi:hypothetical protein
MTPDFHGAALTIKVSDMRPSRPKADVPASVSAANGEKVGRAGAHVRSTSLLSCPFCGCKMGILHLELWRWYGEHRTGCVLESNPSHAYGRCEDMLRAWNTRQDNR